MLKPAKIERDEKGYWVHPSLEDFGDERPITKYPGVEGLECTVVSLEHDDCPTVAERYFERDDPNVSDWIPSFPAGEGAFLVAIVDSEDGPQAIFARPKPEAFTPPAVATCIACGCTDDRACETALGPCSWLRVDRVLGVGVCSGCADAVAAWDAGERAPLGALKGWSR